MVATEPTAANPKERTPSPPLSGPFISFPLSGGNVLEIRLKKRVPKSDFDRIKTLVELSEASLIEGDA